MFSLASRSEASTSQLQPSQFEALLRTLEGFVVADTPPPSTVSPTASSGESFHDDERESAEGLEGTNTPSSLQFLGSRGESSSDSEPKVLDPTNQSGQSMAEQASAVRGGYFAATLARIEGRAPPICLSPIQRYVHQEQVYSDNVEVEHSSLTVKCPRPVSWANQVRTRKLLQKLIVSGSNDFRFDESEVNDEPISPDSETRLAIFRKRPDGFYQKVSGEMVSFQKERGDITFAEGKALM